MEIKKNYRNQGIDLLKCFCAFLVVCIHAPFSGYLYHIFAGLNKIAVPIFFMISGYFYSRAIENNNCFTPVKRILKLLVYANIIYLVWPFLKICIGSEKIEHYFSFSAIFNLVVFDEIPWIYHLWYLVAALVSMVMVLYIKRFFKTNFIFFMIPVLLICNLLIGVYAKVIFGRCFPLIYSRNRYFMGIPFCLIGDTLYRHNDEIKKIFNKRLIWILTIPTGIITVLEPWLLSHFDISGEGDLYISTIIMAVIVFIAFCYFYDYRSKLSHWLEVIGEKYSLWIYIMHPIIIFCCGRIVPDDGVLRLVWNNASPVIVFILTLLFIIVVSNLKKCLAKYLHRKLRKEYNGIR